MKLNGKSVVVTGASSGMGKAIVELFVKEGAKVLFASHVTVPYRLAVVDKTGTVTEISSEEVFIGIKSNRGKLHPKFAEDSVTRVIPLYYKQETDA